MNAAEMKPEAHGVMLGHEHVLPWDLREWSTADRLQAWVRDEIDTLDWANPELAEHLRHRPGYDPKAFLRLLTYAYATATFESDEIQRRCYVDPECERVVGRRWTPGARELTRFRRENRGLLKWALVQVFKQAVRAHLGDFRLPAGVKRRLVDAAVTRLDLARQMDRGYEGI